MKRTRVYIAGKISELPYLSAYEKFERYEYFYYKQDCEVVNPMKICRGHWSWWRCMVKCVIELSKCKRVAFMPDWLHSRGARIEMVVALILGKRIELTKEV